MSLAQVQQSTEIATTKEDYKIAQAGVMVKSIDEAVTVAKAFAASGLFPDIKSAQAAVAKILMGAEFGFTPAASMNAFHIVQGKMQMSGVAIGTLIKRSGKYDYRIRTHTQDECAIEFFQDGESLGTETFTIKDAQRQGTQNTQKYPKNMLFNRAMSNGAKFYTPDIFGGQAVYSDGEIEETKPAPRNGTKGDEIMQRLAPKEPEAIVVQPEPEPITAEQVSALQLVASDFNLSPIARAKLTEYNPHPDAARDVLGNIFVDDLSKVIEASESWEGLVGMAEPL